MSRVSRGALVAALNVYTAGVVRARREYAQHPFAASIHGPACAVEGCPRGRRAARRAAKARAGQERDNTGKWVGYR